MLGMVKEHEITKEFNSLNRKTADKIEKFIKEKIQTFLDYDTNQNNLESALRQFDKEFTLYTTSFQETLKNYEHFFDDFEVDMGAVNEHSTLVA